MALAAWLAGGPSEAQAATREYWIAAVNVEWDVAPNGHDPLTGVRLAPEQRRFMATVYRRYTAGFRRPWPNTAAPADNDGIPGPLIRAQVGDRVLVHFRNLDHHFRRPHSMHFHAFRYPPSSDGAYIPYRSGRGGAVPVGGSFTYRLTAVADSVGVWPYHDHSPSMHDSIAGGLYGVLSIRARGEPPPDREFVLALNRHMGLDTINGRAFIGNVPTFRARRGELVQWDVIGMGDDFHVFHVHGHRWLRNGTPVDAELVGPASSLRVRFVEREPGLWYYHCHVETHQGNGMIGLYRVAP